MSKEKPETEEEWVQYIKDNIDDIDSFVIPIQNELVATDTVTGRQRIETGIGMFLHKCNGEQQQISLPVAQKIINDGIISKMRIPVHLRNRTGGLDRPD